jgi:hypothetical protein
MAKAFRPSSTLTTDEAYGRNEEKKNNEAKQNLRTDVQVFLPLMT